jgi:sugar phosphate permease
MTAAGRYEDRNYSVLENTTLAGSVSPMVQRMSVKKLIKRPKAPLRKLTVKQSLTHRTFWHISAMMMFSFAFADFLKP